MTRLNFPRISIKTWQFETLASGVLSSKMYGYKILELSF